MHPSGDTSAPSLALAIVNGRVWTSDPRRRWADAVLVRGDLIEGVGSSAEIRKRAGVSARVIDVHRLTVMAATPGGVLAAGRPASLVVVLNANEHGVPPEFWNDVDVVLRLERGELVVDRRGAVTPEP